MLQCNPSPLTTTEGILGEARNGRMFILTDDEDRENGGDLIIPAQMATPAAINFMAKHGRGLICLALTASRISTLGLRPMSSKNSSRHKTAFTVSIEAKDGVTTGISASDRARTISAAINSYNSADELVSPGHVFPLRAREGGVLVRAGHTEAAVDVSRLAGLNPSGVICEIINEDGAMARLDDVVRFAALHKFKVGTIKDLIAYRRRHDNLVVKVADEPFNSDYGGEWRLLTYRNKIDGSNSYALQKGKVDSRTPTLVAVHVASILADMLGQSGKRNRGLQRTMTQIGEAGNGLIVLLVHPPGTTDEISNQSEVVGPHISLRMYGIGAQMLSDLKVHDMMLLTNSPQRTVVGLERYGLNIVGTNSME